MTSDQDNSRCTALRELTVLLQECNILLQSLLKTFQEHERDSAPIVYAVEGFLREFQLDLNHFGLSYTKTASQDWQDIYKITNSDLTLLDRFGVVRPSSRCGLSSADITLPTIQTSSGDSASTLLTSLQTNHNPLYVNITVPVSTDPSFNSLNDNDNNDATALITTSTNATLAVTEDFRQTSENNGIARSVRRQRAKRHDKHYHNKPNSKLVRPRARISKRESAPEVRLLHLRLTGQPSRYLQTLELLFLSIAQQESFMHFAGALSFLRSHDRIRLPQVPGNAVAILQSLENIDSGQHAITLLRALVLLQYDEHRHEVKARLQSTCTRLSPETNQIQGEKRLSIAVLDALVNEARKCYTEEDSIKVRTRIQNFLYASRSWSHLHKVFGSGIFALIPRIAAFQIERLPDICTSVFVAYLAEKRGEEVFPLSRALSAHLPSILRGCECILADSIIRGAHQSWSDVLTGAALVSSCGHALDR